MIYTYLVCKYVQICVNPCKFYFKKEKKSFQDLELSIDPCLVGSKCINLKRKSPLILLKSPSFSKYRKEMRT